MIGIFWNPVYSLILTTVIHICQILTTVFLKTVCSQSVVTQKCILGPGADVLTRGAVFFQVSQLYFPDSQNCIPGLVCESQQCSGALLTGGAAGSITQGSGTLSLTNTVEKILQKQWRKSYKHSGEKLSLTNTVEKILQT